MPPKKSKKHVTYLFAVLATGRVHGLNEVGGVADEEREARGAGHHTDDGQPDVRDALRWKLAVADAQHVRQRLEHGPRVLLPPMRVL